MKIRCHARRPASKNAGRLFCALALLTLAQTSAAQSRPSAGIKPFQPGVAIDWKNRAVFVEGRIKIREGPLEYLACFPGKEHESIVLLSASATHVYMALGLIGLNPGSPPIWDERKQRYRAPTGDLVDLTFEWKQDGKTHAVPAAQWLREMGSSSSPVDRPWVFGGSYRLDKQTLAADRTGAGVALVDSPASLLSPSRSRVDRDAELWVEANSTAIPPIDTPVQLVLRRAKARVFNVSLSARGALQIDGKQIDREDLLDLVGAVRRINSGYIQEVEIGEATKRKARQLREWIIEKNVAAWFRWRGSPSSQPATSRP